MNKPTFCFLLYTLTITFCHAQDMSQDDGQKNAIYTLIDQYTASRETKDSVLLNSILTDDIDQLVSSGTWRSGKKESMAGMMRSSKSNPGTRTITVEKVRLLNATCAIADARYVIQNADGSARKMWSSFVVVYDQDRWKISAIRNMLPPGQ